jgi:transcriptional regulator with XRE-family HTH domain
MEQLRTWRVRRFLTQQQLADRVGAPPSTVQRWEAGTRQPRPASLRRLCTALDVPVDALLTPAELAVVGTRPRRRPDHGAPDREAVPLCAHCGQALTTQDQRHLAQGGAAHRSCWKQQQPRPALAPCCLPGGSCGH